MEANGSAWEWQVGCLAGVVLMLGVLLAVAHYRNRRPPLP